MISRLLILLLLLSPSLYADIYLSETRVFNLVTGQARLVSGINVEGDSSGFIVQDANQPWSATAPDGKTYRITTLKYSYLGTITLTVDSSFYSAGGNCSFSGTGGRELFVGWTVMQPGVSGIVYNSAGALFYEDFGGGVGVQTRWRGIDDGQPTFKATFNSPGTFAYVYVSDGPAGMYTMPGGKNVYVHGAGKRPNAVPYADIYGMTCGSVLGVGTQMDTDPVEPTDPDTYCEFSIEGAINLGVLDAGTANGASASTQLYTTCNADSTVTATLRGADVSDNVLTMGGLTIPVTFDEGGGNKLTYTANTGQTAQKINANVSSVGTVEPGTYSKSVIIYLNYQ